MSLKNCPFCGSEMKLYTPWFCNGEEKSINHISSNCILFPVNFGQYENAEKATNAWNKRSEEFE